MAPPERPKHPYESPTSRRLMILAWLANLIAIKHPNAVSAGSEGHEAWSSLAVRTQSMGP
jgi:hypothetical protein